jgi:hypothetical protein
MAERTAYVALRREARILDPRAVQSRLMTGLALAAAGGLLSVVLLMRAGMQDEADTFDSAWARGKHGSVACRTAQLPEGVAVYPPQANGSCVAESETPRILTQGFAAAEPAAAMPRPPERTSRAPTYVRIRKPQPRPDPAEVLLEGLRGRL